MHSNNDTGKKRAWMKSYPEGNSFFFSLPLNTYNFVPLRSVRLPIGSFFARILVHWAHDYCKFSSNLKCCRCWLLLLLATDATQIFKAIEFTWWFSLNFKSFVKHCVWYRFFGWNVMQRWMHRWNWLSKLIVCTESNIFFLCCSDGANWVQMTSLFCIDAVSEPIFN